MMQDRTEQPLAALVDGLRQGFPELFAVYRFGSFGTEYGLSLPVGLVSGPPIVASQCDGVCCSSSTLRRPARAPCAAWRPSEPESSAGRAMNNAKAVQGGYYYGYRYG